MLTQAIFDALHSLTAGFTFFATLAGLKAVIMLAVGGTLLYLGVRKDVEPLLLVPIGFGCLLVNLPFSELFEEHGMLRVLYDMGIRTELFPLLIFVGIGAMIDFTPMLANPRLLLFGAAGQLGIFLTLSLALALGFSQKDAVCIGVIGACDGPTVIYVASKYSKELLGPLSVAAYSYMALVPIIQPPIMRLLTTKKERSVAMPSFKNKVSPTVLILFPLIATALVGLVAPKGLPLMGTIMLGNFMRVSGAVPRLVKASENEIANVSTLFLGLAIGATMGAEQFLKPQTLVIFALGLVAIVVDTAGGILFGKVWYALSGGKVNPLLGAAGISAYPMAARLVEVEGLRENKSNHLLMHAIAANTGGQLGSVMAASIMLAILQGLGVI